jgi:molybdopterin converting factor subunit 1
MVIVAIHPRNTTARRFSDTKTRRPNSGEPYTPLVPEAPPQICVHVRLFASYREAAHTSRLDVPLAFGARVADLLDRLALQIPAVSATRGLMAVNHTYVTPDTVLENGDEVALIPPVSGGADGC